MSDSNFHELIGDDGEFKEPVDADYGVYSVYRRGTLLRVHLAVSGVFACAIVAVVIRFL